MMQGNARGDAMYAMISQNPGFAGLSDAEKGSVRAQLRAIWSADTAYIQQNAQVNPASLQNPAGQPVSTAGSPTAQTGATTAPSTLIGLGTVS